MKHKHKMMSKVKKGNSNDWMEIAKVKDQYFSDITDEQFNDFLIFGGFIDYESLPTNWASKNVYLDRFLGFHDDGTAMLKYDRLSPEDYQLCLTSGGTKVLRKLVDDMDKEINFGKRIDYQYKMRVVK